MDGITGGPGIGHQYLTVMSDLNMSHNIPVVIYDQIGTGLSSHPHQMGQTSSQNYVPTVHPDALPVEEPSWPGKEGDTAFWNIDLFILELENLLVHLKISEDFDILAHVRMRLPMTGTSTNYHYVQSWGGIYGSEYACRRPLGLKRLILVGAPASAALSLESYVLTRTSSAAEFDSNPINVPLPADENEEAMPQDLRIAMINGYFFQKHVCHVSPPPEVLMEALNETMKDPTAMDTMCVISNDI